MVKVGRPRIVKEKDRAKSRSISISDKNWQKVKNLAKEANCSVSEIVTKMIEAM